MKRAHEPDPDADDRERMIAAAERLAALLAGAGSNITVRPIGVAAEDLPEGLRRFSVLPSEPDTAAAALATGPTFGADRRRPQSVGAPLRAAPAAGPLEQDVSNGAPQNASEPQKQDRANANATRHDQTGTGPHIEAIATSGDTGVEAPAGRARGRIVTAESDATSTASAREPIRRPLRSPRAAVNGETRRRADGSSTAAAAAPVIAERTEPADATPRAPRIGNGLAPASAGNSELATALAMSRRAFIAAGVFSFVINILMLAGPLFMLQIYDRVLTTGSISTLIALTVMTAVLYAIIGVLDLVRSRIVSRIGAEVDSRVGDRVFEASLRRSVLGQGTALPALRELDTLRQFLASQGPLTFFDAPWTPLYLAVIFMLHWTLGIAATIGAGLLFALALVSERRSRPPITAAGKSAFRSIELAETGQRNAEAITAMGMLGAYRRRWQKANHESIAWQIAAADEIGGMSALSKALRLLLQSMMLAIGAALAINGQLSAGAIVAGTIIFGRALAPVEQAIGQWRAFLKARESYEKLDDLLRKEPAPPVRTALPPPKGRLTVTGLRVTAPDTRQLILNNVAFDVRPGQMLAVIGPSASGKSTLARTLVGLWPPVAGQVKLDGARIDQWSPEDLGQYIGYLPQNVELFSGTVRENIARFRTDARDEDIVAAAEQAHAHELILALPNGYDTQLGAFATYLSAGQRQRIGLARALFGRPALVVLDEPNSNLDRVGDEALASAIDGMRRRGQTIVLVSHRVQAITMADLLLYIDRGIQRAFGTRDEVMRLFQGATAGTGAPKPEPAAPATTPPQNGAGA